MTKTTLVDLQNRKDERQIGIDQVGIKNINWPLRIKEGKEVQTISSNIDMYVNLPGDLKGTHMSRFVEVLSEYQDKPISVKVIRSILMDLKKRLQATSAYMNVRFMYFVEKSAPVSKKKGFMDYRIEIQPFQNCEESEIRYKLSVPIKTLCPCSKEISKYGAHNQRGEVTLSAVCKDKIWITDLLKIIEDQGSCQVYSLLKRVDEKYVTEKAYENPKFVEDVVRDCAMSLKANSDIKSFEIECENYESIHNHSAYSKVVFDRRKR